MEKPLKMFRRTTDDRRQTTGFVPNLSFFSPFSSFVLRPSSVGTLVALILLIFSTLAYAEDKTWNADSAQTDWFDATSWLPSGAPGASDDVLLDKTDASVVIGQDFNLKSLTLGGKKTSTLTINNFVAGNVKPANATDIAVLNRRSGHMVLKGSAEKVTLHGAYKDSEEVIPEEPTFMFYAK